MEFGMTRPAIRYVGIDIAAKTLAATWLLVSTLNFAACPSPEAAVANAGLTQHSYEPDSSVRGRPRIGHIGHRRLRAALHLTTLSAAQYNPVIKTYYERMRAKGKPPQMARCAAARRLLQIAWAVRATRTSTRPMRSVCASRRPHRPGRRRDSLTRVPVPI